MGLNKTALRRWGFKALILPPVLVGAAVLFVMVQRRQPPEQREVAEAARALRVIETAPQTLVPRAVGYGTAQPATVWSAVAQVRGAVVRTHPELNPGAILRAGEIALQIDPTEYELQIAQQQAQIAQTEAQQAQLAAEEQNVRSSLEIEVESLALAEQDLQRLEGLRRSNSVTAAEFERKQREVLAQRQSNQALSNQLNVLPARSNAFAATRAAQQAALAQLQLDLDRCAIEVPFNCRLSDVLIEPGQFLTAGQQLFQAYGTDVTEVEAQFPISQIRPLLSSDGKPIDLTADAMKRIREVFDVVATVRLNTGDLDIEWEAKFDRVREQLDLQTRTVRIVVAVEDPFAKAIPGERPPLLPGMFCEVELRAQPRTGQLVIPRTAVHDGSVYVVDDENRMWRRDIKIRNVQGRLAVLTDGVVGGERLVISNPVPAIEGMLVDPVMDEEAADALAAEASGAERLP
ncbi:HlyD family efflux transporter periplasmic adaptor subunit [Pirellulales bacterium]|nr:HlyD family efflux transporter periplasmic adaptor subunit [Pirellulales bacterium]